MFAIPLPPDVKLHKRPMISLLVTSLLAQAGAKPVTLQRASTAGEKLAYSVKSHMQIEARAAGLETWMPQDVDINYNFTEAVSQVKPGGMMVISYKRPTMTIDEGETFSTPEKKETEKTDIDMLLTISPINEIVAQKDLSPKKPAKDDQIQWINQGERQGRGAGILSFIGEIYRLAMNAGSLDSSLDFAPKLPLDDVHPGDTWKKTVGFSPQKLEGKNKDAVQRLDYTYTYGGIQEWNGRKVYRVGADLDLDTNLAPFFFQVTGLSPENTLLRAIPTKLKTHIDFDLDMKTGETLHASSQSTGGFSIQTTDSDQALHEERFHGGTELNLVGR